MSWWYRGIVRPLLFTQESESIHNQTLELLGRLSCSQTALSLSETLFASPILPITVFHTQFPNPVGLAAGMDKRGQAVPIWSKLGFGFSEIGGVTQHGQTGNPKPRMFRIVEDQALINRMGFNNPGAEALAQKLAQWRLMGRWPKHPVGINLGKSKITPLASAAQDYLFSFRQLRPHGDFFVVNVSSPNTPNLRELQDKEALNEILLALATENGQHPARFFSVTSAPLLSKPILVKIAPDLTFEAMDQILELVGPRRIAGIVATNTTLARPEGRTSGARLRYAETGGLSGRPLKDRSTEVIRHLFRATQGKLPIIGVGGVFSAEDAWEKITAGASLVQIYTALIFEGPAVVRRIVTGLEKRMKREGMKSISEAVGTRAR